MYVLVFIFFLYRNRFHYTYMDILYFVSNFLISQVWYLVHLLCIIYTRGPQGSKYDQNNFIHVTDQWASCFFLYTLLSDIVEVRYYIRLSNIANRLVLIILTHKWKDLNKCLLLFPMTKRSCTWTSCKYNPRGPNC